MIRPKKPPVASTTKQTSTFAKIRLLLWKNYLLQKRHKLHTIIDLFLPVCFFVCFVLLQKYVGFSVIEQKSYTSSKIDSLKDLYPSKDDRRLIFSPNSRMITNFMDQVSAKLGLNKSIGIMEPDQMGFTLSQGKFLAGIQFHHSYDVKELPQNLSYSIRFTSTRENQMYKIVANDIDWKTNKLFPAINENESGPPYNAEGFLEIQNAIAATFIEAKQQNVDTKKDMPNILIQQFPYPSYTSNFLPSLMPMFIFLSFTYAITNTVRYISLEKENQLKETMKIMGLASWMHYLSWFIRTITMLSIPVIMITLLLTLPWFGPNTAIFPNTNSLCLFVFFMGYCVCMTVSAFLVCAIFATSKTAISGVNLFMALTSAPYYLRKIFVLPSWLKLLLCVFPNAGIDFGIEIINNFESMGMGLTWRTIFQTASVYDNLTVALIFGIFILTAVVIFFLTIYIEKIFPGGGIAKPWYFIFTKAFWINSKNYQSFDENNQTDRKNSHENSMNFESEPSDKKAGIQIRGLTKKFNAEKAAVNKLTMNIYENQITCLLGQNGAGKTTTVSMLTGMLEPSEGTALVNGYDIRNSMEIARSSMGFCPQHNILFDELTVREHILFYCGLKGLSNEAAEDEVQKYLQILELDDKSDTVSTNLSGGMKRKLSVIIALCGNSKVVFLDEPTSGMDPGARRTLWDILLAERKDRTILLTTHFMDEADVLSDRIAILVDGELKCSGSTFFLKKRFGTGYHLVCAKDDNCSSPSITDLLQIHVPDIKLDSENDTEIRYLLPEDTNDKFQAIFEDLEQNECRLNLRGFGVSLTTLEEIFLKIGTTEKLYDKQEDTHIKLNDDYKLLQGFALLRNQTIAMFKKRYLCWLRTWPSFIYMNITIVLLFGFAVFGIGNPVGSSEVLPALNINFNKNESPYAIVPKNTTSEIVKQYCVNIEKYSKAKVLDVDGEMNEALLNLGKTKLKEFKFQYLTAISADTNGSITAWFNNHAYHTAPLALSLVHNAIIKTFIGDDFSIHVTSAPFKFLPKNTTTSKFADILKANQFNFMFGMTMGYLSAMNICFYIKEKGLNAKFMQYASGAYVSIFWGASILWDLLTNMFTSVLMIIILIIGQHEWSSPDVLTALFLIFFTYNVAMIPVTCLISRFFSKPSTGLSVLIFVNIILVQVYSFSKIIPMNIYVGDVIWPYPLCTMVDAIVSIRGCDPIFSWNGIGKHLVLMSCIGILMYLLLLAIESGAIKIIWSNFAHTIPQKSPNEDRDTVDSDVQVEKEAIDRMSINELKSQTMAMQKVSKFYGEFCAVSNISLSIQGGECFGLLGKNGAGKSSIFKMLTGETSITSGEVFTQGFNQKSQLRQIYQIIGYCPQFIALLTNLTCRETLEIFAMLRGIPTKNIKNYIENWARSLDFIEHIDKRVKQLSGGNKRKLSTSLSLIGNLSVIFLDEPSTGLDPATKRNLWNVVIKSREAGKSIVLTTHNIEESEALCTRLTVLVNGKMKCLGSAQHLKSKFATGFELKIKISTAEGTRNTNIIDVKNFVLRRFPGAIFREEYEGLLTYSVPADNIRWSTVFGIMEEAKKTLNIDDYSVNQNSLEQVVLNLFKDQKDRHKEE